MLTNTLKKLIFLARSAKKSTPQANVKLDQNDKQKQPQFSHHISPTLKKLQKRYNDAQQLQIKQQQELQKGFSQFRKSLVNENQKRKLSKQERQKLVQSQLKNLEVPPDLRQRFRKIKQSQTEQSQNAMNNPKQDIVIQQSPKQYQQQEYNSQSSFQNVIKNSRISGKSIKSEQQANKLKKLVFTKPDPLEPQKLKQQMILQQILKTTKGKQATLSLPEDWRKQNEQKQKQKQQQNMILNQRARYMKLKKIAAEQAGIKQTQQGMSHSQLRKFQRMQQKHKIQVSADEVWRSKYSPELIQSAMNFKNKELHYFKQLIQGDKRDSWDQKKQLGIMIESKQQRKQRKKDRQLILADDKLKITQFGAQAQIVQQKGLTRVQDIQYYRQKGLKQFQQSQNMQQYDRRLKQQGQKDIKQSNKINDIIIQEYIDPEEHRVFRKQQYQKSSFGKYENKLKLMSEKMNKLGIVHNYEDLAMLKKQELFADKKIQQENESYRQYLIKKQKKKRMKEQLQQIHKQKLRQDLNYDYQIDPVKLQKLDPLQMQQGLKKIQQMKKLRQTNVVSTQFLKQKIHHTKTFRAMNQFITGYFFNKIQNPHNDITDKVEIGNVIPNRKNTVLNIFWQFNPSYEKIMQNHKFTQKDIKRQKIALQKRLKTQSPYISSKMTQFMGLRYGPDIRFLYNEKLQQTVRAQEQIRKYKDQIVQLTIQQYKQKGLIKTLQQQKQYRNKIEGLVANNLQDLNNQKKLISKVYKKKQRMKLGLMKRKQEKNKKDKRKSSNTYQNVSNSMTNKKRMSQKQISQMQLSKIITEKVEKRKQSIFTPYIQDEEIYFGKEKQFLNTYGRENTIHGKEEKVRSKKSKGFVRADDDDYQGEQIKEQIKPVTKQNKNNTKQKNLNMNKGVDNVAESNNNSKSVNKDKSNKSPASKINTKRGLVQQQQQLKNEKRIKRSPVERMWQQIERGGI